MVCVCACGVVCCVGGGCVCGCVCVARLDARKNLTVLRFRTLPCVPAKRPHITVITDLC